MNKAFIIGNLTRDPELRSTTNGIPVCSFTVAVNRRRQSADSGQPEADYFRVTAWRGLGENCSRFLAKGRKAAITGPVSVSTYTGNDGQTRAQLEITAEDVEFLTPRTEAGSAPAPAQATYSAPPAPQPSGGYVQVDEEELPF